MSWIKPNFLWMMYRSGWATKAGQERILSIKLTHIGFKEILHAATHSSFQEHIYKSHEDWREELAKTEVRLQWDPDHNLGWLFFAIRILLSILALSVIFRLPTLPRKQILQNYLR